MSKSKYLYEAKRWHQTACEDLKASQALYEARHYAQACFYCQQSAEKAIKAIWLMLAEEPWGHSIQKLIQDFPQKDLFDDFEQWVQAAAYLDKFYIPTRYPNGLPDLTPGQVYGPEDAQGALRAAQDILEKTQKLLEESADS